MVDSIIAYIGMGSNLEQPADQIQRALGELQQLPSSCLLGHSSLYSSLPIGPAGQPDYCNAVATLSTQLEALALLDQLQAIEQAHQRVRTQRWGPRTLDLDLLMYGSKVIDHPRLQVPHIRIPERAFVVIPWLEIARDVEIPGMGRLSELAQRVDTTGLKKRDN